MKISTARELAAAAFVAFVGSTVVHVLALGTPVSRYIGRGTFAVWAASVTVMLVVHRKMLKQLAGELMQNGVTKMTWVVYSLFWVMTGIHLFTMRWQEYGYFKISGWVAFGVVIVLFAVQQMMLYWLILPQLEARGQPQTQEAR